MKVNRKTVLSTAAVLGVAALVAGGTIAYFTDFETKTNEFTVGKSVAINLYESQLHRQNSGRGGSFPALASDPDYCDWEASVSVTSPYGNSSLINGSYENARYCTPNMDAGNTEGISAVTNHHTAANRNWGYSDQTIKDDAETYKAAATTAAPSGYFSRYSQKLVPGQWVRKFSYVENTDESNDAYVLIRYKVPTEYASIVELKVPGTPYEEDVSTAAGHQGYFTAVNKNNDGEYVAYDSSAKDSMDNYVPDTEDGYVIYTAVTTQPLNAGEMTFWSPINDVRIKTGVSDADVANISEFPVVVEAEAIQAKPFANAVEAINKL
ncbi:SipW-dependent-type signal peptide-containing protein [Candidatus Saccharibacteria bacterium]|nr:SipW-dependent-type signal peptide-containing protein [Candidatus Saccharibacteria bacterium]